MITEILSLMREIITGLNRLMPAVSGATRQLRTLVRGGERLSYENINISLHLRIRDAAGQRAELERRQEVRFTTAEAGVVRDVVWGEGDPLKGYVVSGATVLGVRREGSKSAMLLSLPNSPARGERATVRSKRLIQGALSRHEEYLEAQLERPTRRLVLKVTFPKGRPAKRAWLTGTPAQQPTRAISVRIGPDGRAFVEWCERGPKAWSTYRLTWCW